MSDRLYDEIKTIVSEHSDLPVASEFIKRIKEGRLTRDENPKSHFCVYFGAYDPKAKKVFIGHHIKSNLWMFNGGHIDKGETPEEAMKREIGEEWGVKINFKSVGKPKYLSITHINQTNIKCRSHFDIWYLVPVSEKSFAPKKELLDTEFYKTGWKNIKEAKTLVTQPNTLIAVSMFEKMFNEK
jgi:8-oxo-dGTP pyrophosphatase MutT (NUDIX family)